MSTGRFRVVACCVCLLAGLLRLSGEGVSLRISAPAFEQGQPIPAEYAYHGRNISPALQFGGVPAGAQSLVLIVDDPDAPAGLWTHWLVWNLPATTPALTEGSLPEGARQGVNSNGHAHYDGPKPPSGTHRYFFHLFALDTRLSLPPGANRPALEAAMKGHVVATGETFGVYSASP
jgi:Raf kinase inhibitor-like YbhB/YbcL family protein